ncbi:MAG TPA: hypothetical protein VII32_18210 [Thermoanaerobaculia bacterium]|jgi:hypothetical protein
MIRKVLLGFIAGFLATIIFHQIALQLLHMAGMVPRAAWAMRPVPPFGVPAVISLSFWGGVWGAIMIPIIDRFRGATYWTWAVVFGAIAPTLVAWFVVSSLKHQPIAAGWKPAAMMIGPIVNGVWGLGTALFYRLMERRLPAGRSRPHRAAAA